MSKDLEPSPDQMMKHEHQGPTRNFEEEDNYENEFEDKEGNESETTIYMSEKHSDNSVNSSDSDIDSDSGLSNP